MELRRHFLAFSILVEQVSWYRWCFLGVGPTLQVKVLNDGVDQLRLRKLYGSIPELLYLYAKEVTDVPLVIDGKTVRASPEVRHDGVNRRSIRAEDDAIIDAH